MKKRTETLPCLHPNTIAALVGRFTIDIAEDGAVTGTVEYDDLSAVYQARNVCGELVELVGHIRRCRGVAALGDLYTESMEKLARVTGIAVAVDDAGFPAQLEFALRYARNPDMPRRMAVYRASKYLKKGSPITELKAMAEHLLGGPIDDRTLADDMKVLAIESIQKRPRGAPRKAG